MVLSVNQSQYAKLIIENPHPLFIVGILKQSAAEIQCHNYAEFPQVLLFLKALDVRQL